MGNAPSYANAVNELDGVIDGIWRQIEAISRLPDVDGGAAGDFAQPPHAEGPLGPFSGMSVRWAILKLLAEDGGTPMATGDIAKKLEEGGVKSKGQRFASIVSAVLSDMRNNKGEVETVADGLYLLTQKGHEVWDTIKKSARYRHPASAS